MRENQRNHRIPTRTNLGGQRCRLALDYSGQLRVVALQSGGGMAFPRRRGHRGLRRPQIHRLPPPLLPLQTVHPRLRKNVRVVLWEAQPQRLQRNLRLTNRRILLLSARTVSSRGSANFDS